MERILFAGWAAAAFTLAPAGEGSATDRQLEAALRQAGFTGRIESTLEQRLGRPIDPALADLGRLLFFDKIGALHSDNSCSGCHAPSAGFGDTQSIAIGIQNNNRVGPGRTGPRNQRRTPVVNTWRSSLTCGTGDSCAFGDPFDNPSSPSVAGGNGPPFPREDHATSSWRRQLPPTELVEVAASRGRREPSPEFDQLTTDWLRRRPDAGLRNDPIRTVSST
jgi:cytochrome c peroxidase